MSQEVPAPPRVPSQTVRLAHAPVLVGLQEPPAMAKCQFPVSPTRAPAQFAEWQHMDNSLSLHASASCQGSSEEGVPDPFPCAQHSAMGTGPEGGAWLLEETPSSRLFLPLPAFLFCPLILDRAVNQRIERWGVAHRN